MYWLLLVFTVFHLFVGLGAQSDKKFFRDDYTYLQHTDSFYKIHTKLRTWTEAKAVCELESATFFYPEDEEEVTAVLDFWNKTVPLYPHAYIGVSSLRIKGVFETVDGYPLSDVYRKWDVGEPNDAGGKENCVILTVHGAMNDDRCDKKYHFICRKKRTSMEWNPDCGMPNMDYVYSVSFGKCYKFHTNPQSWNDATEVCEAEQAYLAVINSPAEANLLKELTERAPKDDVGGSFVRGAVLLGFHNKEDAGWKTVKDVKLEKSGYSKWSYNQPDGGGQEKCGSMFYDGELNDFGCDTKAFFICEYDVVGLR